MPKRILLQLYSFFAKKEMEKPVKFVHLGCSGKFFVFLPFR